MPPDQADLPLLAWRPAGPSEPAPTPDRYTAAANPKPRDYTARWLAWVEENHDLAAELLAMARAHLPTTRCSVDGLFLAIRTQLKKPMNHSLRAAAADWLCFMDPRLADVIERRARKATR